MTELLEMFLRGISFAAILGCVGAPVFCLAVLRDAARETDTCIRTTARVARVSCLLLLAATLGMALRVTASISDSRTLVDTSLSLRVLLSSTYGNVLLARIGLLLAMAVLYGRIVKMPGRILLWWSTVVLGLLLLASVSAAGHAAALPNSVLKTILLDSLHLLGVAAWIGGLFYLRLVLNALKVSPLSVGSAVNRFSRLALACAGLIIVTGASNAVQYLGSIEAFFATSYGLTLLAKFVLFVPLLMLGATNFLVLRPALRTDRVPSPQLLRRFASVAEGELGIGIAIVLLAGALTALPYGGEAAAAGSSNSVFTLLQPGWPHFTTPTARQVWEKQLVLGSSLIRSSEDVAYSEFNHHWAGAFVLIAGVLAFLHAFRSVWLSWARVWPLAFVGLSIFLFFRNDPEAWPLGPLGFWEGFAKADVLQHRFYVMVAAALGIIEWMGRSGKIRRSWWTYLFPGLCLIGGMMLFLHVHEGGLDQADSRTHIQHVVIGTLALLAAVARWIELRLGEESRSLGKVWGLCVTLLGIILFFFYREA